MNFDDMNPIQRRLHNAVPKQVGPQPGSGVISADWQAARSARMTG